MPFEICRHEFKARPAGTVVCSLHILLGMREWRKKRVGFGQIKVLLGMNHGKRTVRHEGHFL